MAQVNNNNNNDLAEQNRDLQRQIAARDRENEELRAHLQALQPADGGGIRRRRGGPDEINQRQRLERIRNFIDNDMGNIPDTTEWRRQRERTIQTLEEHRKKLDTVCVYANYGKAVGNSTEMLGAGGSIVGAVMTFGGSPLGPTVVNIGNIAQLAGTITEGASNGIESLFSAIYLSGIEEVLKKDKRLSLPLANWLNFSREFDANVEAIFGVSLTNAKWYSYINLCREFCNCYRPARSFQETLELMEQGRYSLNIEKKNILFNLFTQLVTYPELVNGVCNFLCHPEAPQHFIIGAQNYRANRYSEMGLNEEVTSFPQGFIPTGNEVAVF